MEHVTYNGTTLTDQTLDEMAKEYEQGTWSGALEEVRMGRPRIADEELRSVTFKLPVSSVIKLDQQAKEHDETRSEFLRNVVDRALKGA